MKPAFFPTPLAFRAWLAAHHDRAAELIVGFYKKESGRPSITWPESVDEALCFGWIDGIRRRLDEERYTIRFTPRRAGSNWSAINIRRVAVLTKDGRMHAAGIAAFSKRTEKNSVIYSYEQRYDAILPPELQKILRAQPKVCRFFDAQPLGYRQKVIYWIATAKQPATRLARLEKLMAVSSRGQRLE